MGRGGGTRPSEAPRALGITAFAIAVVLGILPTVVVGILAATLDENYGWFIFVTLPAAAVGGLVAAILGAIGLVIAARQRSRYGWPIAGLAIGLIMVLIFGYVFWWQ